MRLSLIPHPDLPPGPASAFEVEIARNATTLALCYRLTGAIADLAIPPPTNPARIDELWRHTCFEAFLRPIPGDAYLEFNLAPSTEWATYAFTGYREGMAPADIPAPTIQTRATATTFEITVTLTQLPPGPCRLALTAVIETRSGAKSYWALAHPAGKPDFHHIAGFACDLP
jgi:hypothetical protein